MEQLTGKEEFTLREASIGITVSDFWQWAYSDLIDNTSRGVIAEFLVNQSFNKALHYTPMRANWLPFDVTSPSGRRIEVKSAAYLQSWTTDFPSQIRYDISPKLAWDGQNYATEAKRNCDLYVLCLYTALTREQSILNLDYWEFYVLSTSVLDEKVPHQKGIALSSLLKLEPVKTDFAGLADAIETITL